MCTRTLYHSKSKHGPMEKQLYSAKFSRLPFKVLISGDSPRLKLVHFLAFLLFVNSNSLKHGNVPFSPFLLS